MTFKDAAKLILKEVGHPLTARELVAQMLKRQLVSQAGKTPWLTMSSQIAREIKYKGPLSDFKRSGPGKFVLNDQKATVEEQVRPDGITNELREEEEKEAEGGYVGKAGEHAVLSELLFRGYNASLMSVDTGIDILATKESKVFSLQVKTRNISTRNNAYFFNVRIASFERSNAGGTFYVFILRKSSHLKYLILPLHELEKYIEQEFVHVVGKGKLYRVTITVRDERVCLGRRVNDVSYYLDRWEVIK